MVDPTYRGEIPRVYGYEAHHHTHGLLPRLKIKEQRLGCLPISQKESDWSNRKARMGENDFIRIFGDDEDVKQSDLMTHVPEWLRGYRTKNEYSVLMLKRREFEYWRETKPRAWHHMNQRIKFLYRRINNKYAPPGVEKMSPLKYIS